MFVCESPAAAASAGGMPAGRLRGGGLARTVDRVGLAPGRTDRKVSDGIAGLHFAAS